MVYRTTRQLVIGLVGALAFPKSLMKPRQATLLFHAAMERSSLKPAYKGRLEPA